MPQRGRNERGEELWGIWGRKSVNPSVPSPLGASLVPPEENSGGDRSPGRGSEHAHGEGAENHQITARAIKPYLCTCEIDAQIDINISFFPSSHGSSARLLFYVIYHHRGAGHHQREARGIKRYCQTSLISAPTEIARRNLTRLRVKCRTVLWSFHPYCLRRTGIARVASRGLCTSLSVPT